MMRAAGNDFSRFGIYNLYGAMASKSSTFLKKWADKLVCLLLIFTLPIISVKAWDNEDLEMFDLVEEVNYLNKTFYEVLGLSKDASSSDIRKAYHRLSLKLHPDHNKDANAEQQFRQLVSIAEVLRDENKRQKYNNILENGLPDWKQAVYYYRKVRKLGFLEVIMVLLVIITLGQHIVSWSMYLERKFELEEVLTSKLKKKKDKKIRKNKQLADDATQDIIAEEISLLPRPQFQDLLPFTIIRGLISLITSLPHCFLILRHIVSNWRNRPCATEANPEEESVIEDRIRKPRRKRIFEIPEFPSECILESVDGLVADEVTLDDFESPNSNEMLKTKPNSQPMKNQWTEEDIAALTKIMNKIPSGIPRRWEKIAEQLNRSLQDVTIMAKTLKSNTVLRPVSASIQGLTVNKLLQASINVNEEITERDTLVETVPSQNILKNIHTKRFHQLSSTLPTKESLNDKFSQVQSVDNQMKTSMNESDSWSQIQQKCLELALAQHPRGTEERWEKIAECVPDKSKEDCMKRYKQLAELVKKKRNHVENNL